MVLGTLVAGLHSLPIIAADAPPTPPPPSGKRAAKEAAQEAKKESPEGKKKRDWYPFRGTVESVNTTAGTIQLKKEEGQRVLHLDGKSTLSRLGKPVRLAEIKPGDYAHGKLHKNTRDEEVITDGKFDLEAPKKAAKASKAPKVKQP